MQMIVGQVEHVAGGYRVKVEIPNRTTKGDPEIRELTFTAAEVADCGSREELVELVRSRAGSNPLRQLRGMDLSADPVETKALLWSRLMRAGEELAATRLFHEEAQFQGETPQVVAAWRARRDQAYERCKTLFAKWRQAQ